MSIPTILPYPMPKKRDLPQNRVSWEVNPKRAVLLVHDMQQYFLNAMEIEWAMRTDNDILKIPKKNEYRYAGVERALNCLENGCELGEAEERIVENNKKSLRGFS